MKNTVVSFAYVGSHGIHLIGEIDENPPLPTGVPGAITLTTGQTLVTSQDPWIGAGLTVGPATSPASANGQPIVDPNTKLLSYAHEVVTNGVYSIVANNRINSNFSFINASVTNGFSHYNALQAGVTQRATNGLAVQLSYTYSACTDINSGSFGFDDGTTNQDTYNQFGDNTGGVRRQPQRHGKRPLDALPFHRNKFVDGWQLGAIFSFHTGTPYDAVNGFNIGNDILGTQNRPNVSNESGCNGNPVNPNPVTPNGVL